MEGYQGSVSLINCIGKAKTTTILLVNFNMLDWNHVDFMLREKFI